MGKITFKLEGGAEHTIFATAGETLLALARKANVAIDAPCSGNLSCGKCKVRFLSGSSGSQKTIHIDSASWDAGWRLACACSVEGDAEVMVPDVASAFRSRMKVADLSSPGEVAVFNALQASMEEAGLTKDTGIFSFPVRMRAPAPADTMPDNERIVRAVRAATGVGNVTLPYFALKQLPNLLRANEFALRCICEKHEDTVDIFDLLPIANTHPACGLALDLGTTSVSGLLVDMESGKILSKASAGNGQIRYGADVITRIVEQQKPGGIARLQASIIEETILPLIDLLCECAAVPKSRIYRMIVASNTTMNHLLLGIDANALRTEPFIPAFFHIDPMPAKDIGIELAPGAMLHTAPNIGSYVGGDITAGALAAMIWKRPELSLFIDLGTNGEIVLGNSTFLVACACSAGPAFEGGDISCGMRAIDGAIEACVIDKGTMEPVLSVIGGQKPVGLCGSGIIDVTAELFRTGIINGKGKFVRDGARVNFDEFGIGSFTLAFADESATGRPVAINEVDIDNFIRAKGAIFSAILTLLGSLDISPSELRHVDVAGGIGSGISIKNAIGIGMLPDLPLDKYRYVGNSSLAGAYAMLVSKAALKQLLKLSKEITYLEMSVQPGYMDAFVAACFLPHTDDRLFPSAKIA